MAVKTTKVTRQVAISQIIAGLQQFFGGMPTLVLGGTTYTQTDVTNRLQAVIAAIKQSSNSKAAWLADVQTERNQLTAVAPLLRFIKSFVTAQLGDTQDVSQKLEVFGYTPRKVPSKTVQVKAEAVELGASTRKARSTMGPKQKAKMKGTVPVAPAGAAAAGPAPAASTAGADQAPGLGTITGL